MGLIRSTRASSLGILAAIALDLPAVWALRTPRPDSLPGLLGDGHCRDHYVEEARFLLANGLFAQARANPCLRHMMPLYEQRLEDPEDAVEFLGVGSSQLKKPSCSTARLPSVLYLGMEHAGSTTLSELLNRHDNLSYGNAKEHRYLVKFGEQNYSSTNREYERTFEVACDVVKTFDGTPNTFALALEEDDIGKACHANPGPLGTGAAAMHDVRKLLGPGTQFLVMLRDPLKVLHSLFPINSFERNHMRAVGFCDCFARGLSAWMGQYPRKQFHFLRSEDLFGEPQETLDHIFDFLGVPRRDISKHDIKASNFQGRRRNRATPYLASQLRTYVTNIKDCHHTLQDLSGLTLDWLHT